MERLGEIFVALGALAALEFLISVAVRSRGGSVKEFRKAMADAQPRWAKLYMLFVGMPAWLYIAYRVLTAEAFEIRPLDEVAFVAFGTACVVSTAVIFRAFWRQEI